MFHCRVANVTRVLLCKSNWWKLENIKHEPNNTHIPYSNYVLYGWVYIRVWGPTIMVPKSPSFKDLLIGPNTRAKFEDRFFKVMVGLNQGLRPKKLQKTSDPIGQEKIIWTQRVNARVRVQGIKKKKMKWH